MAAQKGALFLLEVGDGGNPENFTVIAGIRTTSFSLNNQTVNSANIDSGKWQKSLANTGISSVGVSGFGLFTDDTSEETLRSNAFNNSINNYKITFGNGDSMEGPFQITSYSRSGAYNSEEVFTTSLASAGDVTFTTA